MSFVPISFFPTSPVEASGCDCMCTCTVPLTGTHSSKGELLCRWGTQCVSLQAALRGDRTVRCPFAHEEWPSPKLDCTTCCSHASARAHDAEALQRSFQDFSSLFFQAAEAERQRAAYEAHQRATAEAHQRAVAYEAHQRAVAYEAHQRAAYEAHQRALAIEAERQRNAAEHAAATERLAAEAAAAEVAAAEAAATAAAEAAAAAAAAAAAPAVTADDAEAAYLADIRARSHPISDHHRAMREQVAEVACTLATLPGLPAPLVQQVLRDVVRGHGPASMRCYRLIERTELPGPDSSKSNWEVECRNFLNGLVRILYLARVSGQLPAVTGLVLPLFDACVNEYPHGTAPPVPYRLLRFLQGRAQRGDTMEAIFRMNAKFFTGLPPLV